MTGAIDFTTRLDRVDWEALTATLAEDRFDNGRTPDQLRRSFENSARSVLALSGGAVVGTARVLSDGVCNAYLVDVWTHSRFRRRGVARRMIEILQADLRGQHLSLFTDDAEPVFRRFGFERQRGGMSKVVGRWLEGGA
ncbi:MAG: GNAT family N-acetyltransferase [Candidatus Eisenbacteria bacterium]|nr:GNAT family N-acetyltransferase [Candidatus Latescibacterota bacterium]MBD3301497.1 GNAT family N-acetyltransferase [Candidatus Eisenbacteria bacterium]